MNITAILRREYIIPNLKATVKEEALGELASPFPPDIAAGGKIEMLKVLLERERLGSTGIGEGIAIPHGKVHGLDDLILSFGRSKKGVDFDAMDGKPVYLFFLLVAPEGSQGQHLKVLARISRMLKDEDFRKRLMEAESREELYQVIADRDAMI